MALLNNYHHGYDPINLELYRGRVIDTYAENEEDKEIKDKLEELKMC